jgi:hypothetical protein
MKRREMLYWLGLMASSGSGSFGGPNQESKSGTVQEQRDLLYGLLGDLPDRERSVGVRRVHTEERDHYVLEKLELELNGIEPVPAFLTLPKQRSGRVPGVLFNHSHGGGYEIGKNEFLEGREYLAQTPYAEELAKLGYAALCIDSWVFGERSHTTESDMFKAMLWKGQVLWGMMVFDGLKALDYLISRPEVDENRIGTVGISMGSTMAWWLAALDERIQVTVDICCLTEFQILLEEKGLSRHGIYYYVPSLLKHFTTAQINALIAPRYHLGIAGLRDPLTPVKGLDIIDAEMKKVYARRAVPDRWKLLRYDVGHQETADARREILRFFKDHL